LDGLSEIMGLKVTAKGLAKGVRDYLENWNEKIEIVGAATLNCGRQMKINHSGQLFNCPGP